MEEQSEGGMELSKAGVVGISIGSFVLGLILCLLVVYLFLKKTSRGQSLRGRPQRKGRPRHFQ